MIGKAISYKLNSMKSPRIGGFRGLENGTFFAGNTLI
jgi:hypothetical protein